MAVGDAYGATEWREGAGDDEVALRTERIERRICHAVAEFSFRQAERMGAKVFGGPKYTVSPIYEGMLKEEMDEAAARHPDVPYEPQLIDATFALLISSSGAPMVIPALNRDGDILSDLVLPLFGSIAGSESLLVAFGDDYVPSALMAEAAHGTAPALQGKDVANPMAMILAGAVLLSHADQARCQTAGRDPGGLPRGRCRGSSHGRPRRPPRDARSLTRSSAARRRSSRSGHRSRCSRFSPRRSCPQHRVSHGHASRSSEGDRSRRASRGARSRDRLQAPGRGFEVAVESDAGARGVPRQRVRRGGCRRR